MIPEDRLALISDRVYHDQVFSLYEMRHYRSMIDSPNVSFEIVSPVKYRVSFLNVRETQELALLQNFNKDWKVFLSPEVPTNACRNKSENQLSKTTECVKKAALFEKEDLSYLWQVPLFESSHRPKWGYANSWDISPDDIRARPSQKHYTVNPNGSLNFTLTVYYHPEVSYLLSGVLSLLSATSIIGLLLLWRYSTSPKLRKNKI